MGLNKTFYELPLATTDSSIIYPVTTDAVRTEWYFHNNGLFVRRSQI